MDTKSNANILVVDMHNFMQFVLKFGSRRAWCQITICFYYCLECVLIITITSDPNSGAASIPYFTDRQSI